MKTPCIYSRLSRQARIRGAAILHAIVLSLADDDFVDAATKEWSGNDLNDSNWTSNNNWAGIGGAGANDDLVFPGSAGRLTNNNDFAVNTNFNSLRIRRGLYVISGNQIFLANGINTDFDQGPEPTGTFNPNIVLGANQTWTSGFGNLTLNGVVNLNNHDLIVTGTLGLNGFILNGTISGTGTITKNGNAKLTIAGDASGFGPTTMNGGLLHVTGTLGAVNLQGGMLSGTGTVGAITGTGGVINPGTNGVDAAILTSNGAGLLNSSTTLQMDVHGTTVGTDYDQLLVTSANINLNNASLDMTNSFDTGDFIPSVGDTFTIVSQTGIGSISGQFFGPGAQGTSINVHGQLFTIAYTASSVTLTAQGQFLTWDGGGTTNNWSEDLNWDFNVVPGNAQSLSFPAGVPADSLTNTNNIVGLKLGTLSFTGAGFDIKGNAIELANGLTSNVSSGSGVVLGTNLKLLQAGTFLNNGGTTTTLTGQVDLTASGFILTIDGSGNHVISGPIVGTGPVGVGGLVKNGTGTLSLFSSTANTYTGQTLINNGIVRINNPDAFGAIGAGNNTVVASGATLILESNVIGVPETISINGTGVGGTGALSGVVCNLGCSMPNTGIQTSSTATINVPTNGHSLTLASAPAVGLTKIGAGTLILGGNSSSAGAATVNAGTLIVNGSNSNCTVDVTGGTLGGGGSVGSITAGTATIAPGQGAGTLSVSGNVIFNAGITFTIEIGGSGALADKLSATGTVSLGAGINNLTGSLINGFAPSPGQIFTIIQSTGGLTGTFAQSSPINISGTLFQIVYNANNVLLVAQGGASPTPTATATATATATPTATATATPAATGTATATATPAVGLVGNVSTRLPVGTGNNVLIEGFIVQGPNGSTKKILVRAIGPSLLPFGIPDAMANPTLEIRDASNTLIASNNDWKSTQLGGIITTDQFAEINGSGLAPGNDSESAIIADLAPGDYTAVVRGFGDTSGTGLVDGFDLSAASPARLANVATRGLIQPGDQLMIAGFIVQNGPVRVVILAVGPSLSSFGITNALPDTTLQLRDQNGVIVRENDDWESDQKAEVEATGLQPSDLLEAALVVTIPPGQYTAQVRGKPERTGIGVVEVFFLQ